MSVRINGISNLLRDLERHLGESNIQRITDEALKSGAEVFIREMKAEFESFRDTGASIDEMTISEPHTDSNGARAVKIHWKGPDDRYRIIHLNEWGTVNNPNPRGKGAIARSLNNAKREYREVLKRKIREGIQ
jgi:hypothetical protein